MESEVFLRERSIKIGNSSIYYPHAKEKMEHFNWVLKELLQTADLEGKPCKSFAIDFLQDWWETGHEATPLSATALVTGQRTQMKLSAVFHKLQPELRVALTQEQQTHFAPQPHVHRFNYPSKGETQKNRQIQADTDHVVHSACLPAEHRGGNSSCFRSHLPVL